MAIFRCFCGIFALMMITSSNAGLDDHDRTIVDEDINNYDDILDAIHEGKYYRNNDDIDSDNYGTFRARDYSYDGDGNIYEGQNDDIGDYGIFIDKYDDGNKLYSSDVDFEDKNGISNSDVGVYNMYRSRGRGTPGTIDKAKLHTIITLLHQYSPLMKLFSMKANHKKRVAWRKWIGWYDSSNNGLNGIG
ncbi:uncharacterized protein LOC133524921 [Cydia pomonella]|uniref:uncharacterized protein LOC133524921 n=1 Tax=Cydia pomonella TaxID=82600 RepID=UPI002ADDD031|nr:uncharacterized protein LOC133524921 [Cydia pomonella]